MDAQKRQPLRQPGQFRAGTAKHPGGAVDRQHLARQLGPDQPVEGRVQRREERIGWIATGGVPASLVTGKHRAVPLFAAMCVSASGLFYIGAVCLLLAIVSVGCFAFVLGGVNHSAMQALLEEEDYTRENKAKSPVIGAVSGIYWLLVTAVYLFYTFGPMGNGQPKYSWFIWAVAGVLFGAVMLVVKLIARRK